MPSDSADDTSFSPTREACATVLSPPRPTPTPAPRPLPAATAAALAAAALAACGGGGSSAAAPEPPAQVPPPPPDVPSPPPPAGLSAIDASRFLTQATFGARGSEEVAALQAQGLGDWLTQQFATPAASHVAFLDEWRTRKNRNKVSEEASYEAVWQQWLWGADPLRCRVVWSLLQVFVISNIAPDVRPYAMSSYMDMLGRNAFGNYRQLLEEVALHPAMGYYLNMLESGKENPALGTHPSENFAREVLQLFSIGLVKLHADGTPRTANGAPLPTYDQTVVQGFAKAFTGWSFGNQDTTNAKKFNTNNGENTDANWLVPMKAWPSQHDSGPKTLLDGRGLPAGQTAEQDLKDALDTIFQHPNVGPFFGRLMIQRLVTSNPSPAYVQRVATAFDDNGAGVRGDLQALWRAILLDPEARGDDAPSRAGYGKLREPVVRFANVLRALGAASSSGYNEIDYLDSADNALGQSPLLAPSVFNFYSPAYRPAGPVAAAGLVAPEFQITSETSVAGSMNFFAALFDAGGYGSGPTKVTLDYAPLIALAATPAALVARLNELFFNRQMGDATRQRLTTMLTAMSRSSARERVTAALKLTAMSTDFVIQK